MKRKYKVDRVFEVNENDSVRDANDEFDSGYVWADVERFINYYGTEIKEPKKPVTYEYGDRFRDKSGDECMIIRLSESECILAATTGNDRGNRYRDTAVHVHFVDAITQEELDSMAGPAYTPLTKIEEE